MAASALYSGTVFVPPLSHKTPKHVRSICFNPSISLPRSRFCAIVAAPSLSRRVFRVHGLMGDESETAPKPESPNSEASASIDLNLPRRSLLVQFTCVCGERTKRLVNRLAYERGAVFVQSHRTGIIPNITFEEELFHSFFSAHCKIRNSFKIQKVKHNAFG